MRVLLVHNFYGSEAPSGENEVFDAERRLLQLRGHEVETFTRHSDEIRQQRLWGSFKGALATPWNPWMATALRNRVNAWAPDVVHVHNTFPLISPAIFSAIGNRAKRVLTLHNYRLFCSAAIPMRAGAVCTECLDLRSSWPAIRHGCYRDSRLATLPLAASIELHRRLGTWQTAVDAFITLSEFQRQRLTAAGIPSRKIHVKPNFYPGTPPVVSWVNRDSCAVFVGRLTHEKGVSSLVRAWSAWAMASGSAPELRIVGEGVLRAELEALAVNLPVRFLGKLSSSAAQAEIARAKLLIVPSECFEGFPMVIREAFAFGTPVAVSDLGPLPSIVRQGVSGVVFDSGNPGALFRAVQDVWQTPGLLERLSGGARAAFEAHYTEDVNYKALIGVYDRAILGQ